MNIRNYSIADNSAVTYTHAQYYISGVNTRPRLGFYDIGTAGEQCNRISCWQNNAGTIQNETYVQFKPTSQKIEVSVPISMITEPTYTGLNLVTKNYVDGAISSSTSST